MRLSLLTIAGAAPLYLGAQTASSPRPTDPAFRSLDSAIAAVVRDSQVPGLAIGVIRGGRLAFANGYGARRLGAADPITPRSLFHMASVTKPFVATAIMQLVERGKVDLDAPLVTYLPYFRVKDSASVRITVRQMLTHTSGMRDVTDYRWDHPEYDDGALERYVRALADSTLLWPPGTRFRYSNIAFEVLADVIAKVSGTPFESYVRREILAPAGMRASTLMKPEADTSLLTSPHVQRSAGNWVVAEHFPYNRPHAASSTLLSNVEDMSRWALLNLQRGTIDGRQLLRRSSYDVLWSPQARTNAPPGSVSGDSVGLSWFLGRFDGRRVATHSGGDDGYRSFLILVPDAGVGVVIMTNSERGSVMMPIVRRALTAALDKAQPLRE